MVLIGLIIRNIFERVVTYYRSQLTFHCNIPNFVAKLANLYRSSKVYYIGVRTPVGQIKNLFGFVEFRVRSPSLFTNWLANSEMNFTKNFGMLQ